MRTTFESIYRSRAEDIVEKKHVIASKLQHAPSADMDECRCIITAVGIVDVSDAPGNTVISDIAPKREAEINSESRRIVVVKKREARVIEAEIRQEAEKRESAAVGGIIGARNREEEQHVFVSSRRKLRAKTDWTSSWKRTEHLGDVGACGSKTPIYGRMM